MGIHKYDHFTFPGAVPRTFISSVLLAWVSTPFIWLSSWLGLVKSKFELQIIGTVSFLSSI
jgi:alpha-1,6-mannosyltransferase